LREKDRASDYPASLQAYLPAAQLLLDNADVMIGSLSLVIPVGRKGVLKNET
jgi:hypothetical protein